MIYVHLSQQTYKNKTCCLSALLLVKKNISPPSASLQRYTWLPISPAFRKCPNSNNKLINKGISWWNSCFRHSQLFNLSLNDEILYKLNVSFLKIKMDEWKVPTFLIRPIKKKKELPWRLFYRHLRHNWGKSESRMQPVVRSKEETFLPCSSFSVNIPSSSDQTTACCHFL